MLFRERTWACPLTLVCLCYSSNIWNYWIRNTGGYYPICSFTICMWFYCLWASVILFLNLLVIFPMASLTTFWLFSLAVAIPFFCVLRAELLCLRYGRGMRDPSRGSETCSVEMRIDRSIGIRWKGPVSCGRRGWGVVSIPGRNEGWKVLFGKLVDKTSALLVLQGSRVPMSLWCRGCQTCCPGGLKKPVKLHRAIEDEEDRGPEVIPFFSTIQIKTEIVFIVDVQALNISLS